MASSRLVLSCPFNFRHGAGPQHRGIVLAILSGKDDRQGYQTSSIGVVVARCDAKVIANRVIDSTHYREFLVVEEGRVLAERHDHTTKFANFTARSWWATFDFRRMQRQ